eukprot:gene38205-47168_t
MSHIRRIARQNKTMLMKTGSYYLIHICVAAMVAYAVTGNLLASLTLSLLEPTVQAVALGPRGAQRGGQPDSGVARCGCATRLKGLQPCHPTTRQNPPTCLPNGCCIAWPNGLRAPDGLYDPQARCHL